MTVFEESNRMKRRSSHHKTSEYAEKMESSGSELFEQSSPATSHQALSARSAGIASQRKARWNESPTVSKIRTSPRVISKTVPQYHREITEDEEVMVKEISTETPITQHQLVTEVKSIYAGLVMVESKCIAVQEQQAAILKDENHPRLNGDQFRALITLHRVYLHEHHDFMLASQHPSASPALKALVSKYSMIARMWRHGIHGLLELLRHRLAYSREYMVEYIYIAYSIMAELYEQMPVFDPVWSECLGDLSRYRMAVTDSDDEERAVWVEVSKHWYGKGIDNNPTCGRLYHHIAVVAGQNPLEQLFLFEKSLCVATSFDASRVSLSKTLFDRENRYTTNTNARLNSLGESFIYLHKLLFTAEAEESFDGGVRIYLNLLDCRINKTTPKFLQQASQIAVSSCLALTEFGKLDGALTRVLSYNHGSDAMKGIECAGETETAMREVGDGRLFNDSQRIFFETATAIFQRFEDPNINGFVHVTLNFLLHISQSPAAMGLLLHNSEHEFPLYQLTAVLNFNLRRIKNIENIGSVEFPRSADNTPQPLPEDLYMRGLNWIEGHIPENWFQDYGIAEGHWEICGTRMEERRRERIVWLGLKIANVTGRRCFEYDAQKQLFFVPALGGMC